MKKAFNGHQETASPPTPLTSVEVYEKENSIDHTFDKSRKKSFMTNIWKKKSIFFDLSYWSKLEVRHCINVMHVEKNVCGSLIGTLFNIIGKMKMLEYMALNERGVNCLREVFEIFFKFNKILCMNPEQKSG